MPKSTPLESSYRAESNLSFLPEVPLKPNEKSNLFQTKVQIIKLRNCLPKLPSTNSVILFFPCLVYFDPSDQSGMLCSDTTLAGRTNSLAERTNVDLHCQVESVIWKETNLSWHHKYPTVDMTLFDPVVKNSTFHFAYMGISSSGEYTCMAEYDGQVVLQYTVVLNVFCKYHDQVHDFLSMAPKFDNTPGGGGGGELR